MTPAPTRGPPPQPASAASLAGGTAVVAGLVTAGGSANRIDAQREQHQPGDPGEGEHAVGHQHLLGCLAAARAHDAPIAQQAHGEGITVRGRHGIPLTAGRSNAQTQ